MKLPSFSAITRRAAPGFTLIELLVAMLVGGILVAMAVPAFNNFVQNDRDVTQVNSLAMSLNYARSEAVKRNTAVGVQVCPSAGGLTCDAPGGGWGAGWIVLDLDPTDPSPVLQVVPALAGTNVLSANAGAANGITFKSSGGAVLGGGAKAIVKICDTRGAPYARDVEVTLVGTVTSSQKAGTDASGVALTCP